MTDLPGNNGKKGKVWIVVGLLFILIGVVSNEWVLASLFSVDGVISPLSKNIIRTFDAIMVIIGVTIVKYRRGLSPLLSVKVGSLFIVSTVIGFALMECGSYLGLKYVLAVPMEKEEKELPENALYLWTNDSDILPFGIKKNFRQKFDTNFFQTSLQTNNVGMRESADYHGEKVDIGFVGDSFTFGYGVNYGERYSDLLRDYFPEKNILSYGYLSGLTPPHFYLFIKNNPQYMPELLIMGFYPSNDLSMDMYDTRLIFDDEGEPVAAKSVIRYVQDSGALGVTYDKAGLRIVKLFLEKFYTGKLSWIAWQGITESYNKRSVDARKDEWNRRQFQPWREGPVPQPQRPQPQRPQPQPQRLTDVDDVGGIQVLDPDDIFDENSKTGLEYIEKLNQYSVERGTRLLVFMIPNIPQVLKKGDDPFPLWGPIKQWLSNRKIEVIDPLEEFIKYEENGTAWSYSCASRDSSSRDSECSSLYYYDEMHWTRNGHKLAAELIFKYLVNSQDSASPQTQILELPLAVD